jgi:hypothetical protein
VRRYRREASIRAADAPAQPAAIGVSANGTVTRKQPTGGMSSMPISSGASVHQNDSQRTQPMA